MELLTLGIDLGKTPFHLVGMNQRGEVVLRKRFSRVQLLHFTANLKVKLIGMEACGGSQTVGHKKKQDGIVLPSTDRPSLHRVQHPANFIPGDGTRHVVQTIDLRHPNRTVANSSRSELEVDGDTTHFAEHSPMTIPEHG